MARICLVGKCLRCERLPEGFYERKMNRIKDTLNYNINAIRHVMKIAGIIDAG